MNELTAVQVRILGVLIEKQLTTPQQYPLTENALLVGCNQSTNRDPVVDYDQSDVRGALIELRRLGLTKRVMRAGERAEKHAHRVDEQLGLATVGPLAVLGLLLLRGAQTPGELRSRTTRLHSFEDAVALDAALTELQDRALAEPLPRRPGEKQIRWRHLLGANDPMDAGGAAASSSSSAQTDEPPSDRLPTVRELVERVEALTARVDELERELGLGDPGAEPVPDPDPDHDPDPDPDHDPDPDPEPYR